MACSDSPAGAGSRSLIITAAPAAASFSAIARPMPRPAPVTSATFPSKENDIKNYENTDAGERLAKQIFQLYFGVRSIVAVLYDDRRVDGNAPVFARSPCYCARTGYQHGAFRNDERSVSLGAVNLAAYKIV